MRSLDKLGVLVYQLFDLTPSLEIVPTYSKSIRTLQRIAQRNSIDILTSALWYYLEMNIFIYYLISLHKNQADIINLHDNTDKNSYVSPFAIPRSEAVCVSFLPLTIMK